ncbi:MAG: tetratricopeptide repeat protein [Thermodesulfobacteriota bacterium]
MRILKSLYRDGKGLAVFAVAALLLAAPYGCSKESSKAPGPGEAVAPEAPAPGKDAAKERFDKGVEFSLKGEIDSAIKEYEAALELNPGIPEAHNNLGFAYMDKGELTRAVEHQKKALELKPDLANGYFGLALAYEKLGKKEEAIKNWKEFMKLSQPHSKWWMNAQEHINVLEGKTKKAAPPAKKAPAKK